MKIVLFSDIHANLPALEAVLISSHMPLPVLGLILFNQLLKYRKF